MPSIRLSYEARAAPQVSSLVNNRLAISGRASTSRRPCGGGLAAMSRKVATTSRTVPPGRGVGRERRCVPTSSPPLRSATADIFRRQARSRLLLRILSSDPRIRSAVRKIHSNFKPPGPKNLSSAGRIGHLRSHRAAGGQIRAYSSRMICGASDNLARSHSSSIRSPASHTPTVKPPQAFTGMDARRL